MLSGVSRRSAAIDLVADAQITIDAMLVDYHLECGARRLI
jgi:hypothetical protein